MDYCEPDYSSMDYYACKCPIFLNLNNDSQTCSDLDECARNLHSCNENQACTNILITQANYLNAVAGFSCSCKQGFYFDPAFERCMDIDECRTECQYGAHCTNIPGGYNCTCKKGFLGDGKNCTDIDECLVQKCGGKGVCKNIPGSYYCKCNPGFTFGSGTCWDMNECEFNIVKDYCSSISGICSNTIGNFKCLCNVSSGYKNNSDFNKTCEGMIRITCDNRTNVSQNNC